MNTKTTTSSTMPPIGPQFPWLAPLAGFSDLPFRLLCREMGAAAACTEMVSAKGLVFGHRQGGKGSAGTDDLLVTTAQEGPLVVQLFGAEPDFVGEAVSLLLDRGFTCFDLNMGCSVPKVTKTGAGAAMLKDPQNAVAVAKAMMAAGRAHGGGATFGFKMRLGWDASSRIFLSLAKALEDAGADWLTLHPRYARQAFSGVPERDALAELAGSVRIPVIASGDLFTAPDALDCIRETGVAGIMFARGAMANPAIFREYHSLREGGEKSIGPESGESALGQQGSERATGPEATQADAPASLCATELYALIRRHAELARELTPGKPGRKGFAPALLKMRTVVPRYVRHLPGVKQLRLALGGCESWEHFEGILAEFFGEV